MNADHDAGPDISSGPVLVFDGECGFCARGVRTIVRLENRGSLRKRGVEPVRFAARQGEAGMALRERHPEVRDVESMLWIEPDGDGGERVLIRSDSVLAMWRYLGGVLGALAVIGSVVPRGVRDWFYRRLANNRHRLGGSCAIPDEEMRGRLLN